MLLWSYGRSWKELATPLNHHIKNLLRLPQSAGESTEIITGIGNRLANVWVIGYQPDAHEIVPFTGENTSIVTHTLRQAGASLQGVFLTYIRRTPGEEWATRWEENIRKELTLVWPHAVILLGNKCAEAVLGVKDTVDRLRGTRFYFGDIRETSYFVTYAPHEVVEPGHGGMLSRNGLELFRDVVAVCAVTEKYFSKTRELKRREDAGETIN